MCAIPGHVSHISLAFIRYMQSAGSQHIKLEVLPVWTEHPWAARSATPLCPKCKFQAENKVQEKGNKALCYVQLPPVWIWPVWTFAEICTHLCMLCCAWEINLGLLLPGKRGGFWNQAVAGEGQEKFWSGLEKLRGCHKAVVLCFPASETHSFRCKGS